MCTKSWKFIKILVVHTDVVATISGGAPGLNVNHTNILLPL